MDHRPIAKSSCPNTNQISVKATGMVFVAEHGTRNHTAGELQYPTPDEKSGSDLRDFNFFPVITAAS
jgi:hypothetical protein